ncbi:MAG: winged helix-turn-helix domain-containing protein [Bryobacteraceae bacterium]
MASSKTQVPSFDQLMWPAIDALKQMGGSASHQELLDKVIEIAKIPEDAPSVAHTTGRQSRVSYNLRWAESHVGRYRGSKTGKRRVWRSSGRVHKTR